MTCSEILRPWSFAFRNVGVDLFALEPPVEREVIGCRLPLSLPLHRLQDAAVEQLDGLHQGLRRRHPGAIHEREEESERRRSGGGGGGAGHLQGPQGDPRLQRPSLLGGAAGCRSTGAERSCVKTREREKNVGPNRVQRGETSDVKAGD